MEPLNSYHENKPIHDFLISLDQIDPKKADPSDIKKITKKCLGISLPFFSARTKILEAVETLKKDVSQMPDFGTVQKEIAGAVNGLNILCKNAKSASDEFKNDLLYIRQSSQQIEDIFLIKEAIAEEPSLQAVLENPDYFRDFSILRSLYGRRRELESPMIISLMKAWEKPEIRPLLQSFIHEAYQVRQENLHQLVNGNIPSHMDIPMSFFFNQTDLIAQVQVKLSNENFVHFRSLMDDLLYNRATVTNTQVLNDLLPLAFNGASETTTIGNRARDAVVKGRIHHLDHLEKLNEKLQAQTDPTEQKKVEKEIQNWKKLEDFYSRYIGFQKSFFYQRSTWIPTLGPDDSIQPLKIVVGFAIKEGITRESETSLDITPALGEANLNLTVKERDVLGELLVKCGLEITKKEPILENWRKTKQLPESIAIILTSFHDDKVFPHLSQLTIEQIDILIDEMFRFSFESNFHLADDLLNLC